MRGALALALLLGGCIADETISGYAGTDRLWRLQALDGAPFEASATLRFEPGGGVSGQAPCNVFRATQSAPLPWFALSPIAATKRACSDLPAEAAFLSALQSMTLAEVSGPVLLLSNDAGRQMVFRAE